MKAKTLEVKLAFSWGRGGGGCKTKNLPLGEYGYFLEPHIVQSVEMLIIVEIELYILEASRCGSNLFKMTCSRKLIYGPPTEGSLV